MKQIKILILSLTLAACLDTRAAIQRPTSPSPTPPATATALHIRSGAGVSYAVAGYLKAGDIVTIQNQAGAWFEIFRTGTEIRGAGWIHSKYCEVKK